MLLSIVTFVAHVKKSMIGTGILHRSKNLQVEVAVGWSCFEEPKKTAGLNEFANK